MAGTRAPEAGQEDTDYDNRMVAAYTRWIRGSDSSRPGERLRACILPSGFQNKVCRVWREDLQGMSISHDGALEDATIVKWALRGEPLPLWVEHHSLRILDGQGIAPRAYCLDLRRDPFPYPVMVCECLPGSELASADLDAAMLTRIGRLLRRVHAQDGEAIWDALPRFPSYGFGDLRDYMADTVDMFRYYARYRQEVGLRDDTLMESMYHCVERLLRFVEDSVAAWEKWGSGGWPLKLCHGDPVPHNFLWDAPRQRLYLIDWERAGVGDPAYELAWFVALNHLDEAGEHALLAGYRQEAENQAASGTAEAASIDAQVERIHAYRKVTAMSWPIQILAYQARYWRERFPVTMTPHEYVAFNKREAYRRLADGFTYVGRAFGGWTATSRQLESMGSLLAMPD